MARYCDLHTHSHYSDGTFSPAEILRQAAALGLSAVALTDHNTLAGLPEFLAAGKSSPVRNIPGVEISAEFSQTELHILGLFLPEESFEPLSAYLDVFLQKKEESNQHLVAALAQAGYHINYDAIRQKHPEGTVNRATIAAALLEKGYVGSIQEAFQNLLSKKAGFYVPPQRPDALETIALLKKLRAVPVLAHPFLNLKTPEALRSFLAEAVPRGLAGLETHYSSFSPEETALAQSLAVEFGLLESGGSDYHGDTKPHIHLGTGYGTLAVPSRFADAMETCI